MPRGGSNSVNRGDRQTAYHYDGAWLAGITNDLGQTTSYLHDSMGRVTGLQLADTRFWDFERDGEGRLVTLTEPDATIRHYFTYTPIGLLESYTSPMGAVEHYAYDADKLPIQREYPSGKSSLWQYNTKGQLTGIQTPEGSHSFFHDLATGMLSRETSFDGLQVDFTYDGDLLLEAAWSVVVSGSVTREYDNFFRVSRMIYPGADLSMAYDGDGLLTGVGSVGIIRDADNGLVAGVTDGSFSMAYTRNTYGEIETATATHGATLYDVSTTYDDLGRISLVSETIGGSTRTWSYDFNAVGQLIQVARDGVVVEGYAYDAAGNRTAVANTLTGVSLGAGDFSYDPDHKLLAAGTTTYDYDADGRLTRENRNGSVTEFQYNTDGTLAAATLPDNRVITYLHDARGRRIARAVDGVRTHAWLYGDGLMPLAEFDGTGNLKRSFIYTGEATPTAFIQGGQTYHIVSDHLGSPRLIVDDSGAVMRRIDYDAYGNVIADSNPGMDLPFGFAGGMTDPDHELIRFGVRDYQPSMGRWTAKDPILFNGGLNLYGYVQNDPVNRVDREGKQSVIEFGLIVAVVVLAGSFTLMVFDSKIRDEAARQKQASDKARERLLKEPYPPTSPCGNHPNASVSSVSEPAPNVIETEIKGQTIRIDIPDDPNDYIQGIGSAG